MSSVELEIEKLRLEIDQLRLSTSCTIESLKKRINKLHKTRAKVTPVNTAQHQGTGHKDKSGRNIFLGDTVKFITSGRYDSAQGTVTGFSKSRVLSTDYKNREIPRAPHNLLVISK